MAPRRSAATSLPSTRLHQLRSSSASDAADQEASAKEAPRSWRQPSRRSERRSGQPSVGRRSAREEQASRQTAFAEGGSRTVRRRAMPEAASEQTRCARLRSRRRRELFRLTRGSSRRGGGAMGGAASGAAESTPSERPRHEQSGARPTGSKWRLSSRALRRMRAVPQTSTPPSASERDTSPQSENFSLSGWRALYKGSTRPLTRMAWLARLRGLLLLRTCSVTLAS
mmetsp:Transcript_35361/g.117184  ORF Transcript_35361/g.117184 Transcript_35361/m.117184 type:complete len:227 (-) Transcript_35361:212-892(-)